MVGLQRQLEHLPVVEARSGVAGVRLGLAGGAETAAVGVALPTEHEANGAGHLGGAGPGGVGGHRHRASVLGSLTQAGQGTAETVADEDVGDVTGILTPLQVPEGQGSVQQSECGLVRGQAFDGVGQSLHLPHGAERAQQGPAISVSPEAPSGERRYRSSSTARAGSLNNSQPGSFP